MHYSEATAATDTPVRTATQSRQRMCTHRSAKSKKIDEAIDVLT